MLERQDDVDVLEAGDDRPSFTWRSLSRREVITLVLLIAVGLVAGGGATIWWQHRRADLALASEAHVVGYVLRASAEAPTTKDLCTHVRLRLINAGRRPITIEAVDVDLSRLRTTSGCDAPRTTRPVEVAPLAGVTWTVPARLDCDRRYADQEIRATVRTQSGAIRTESIAVGGYVHEVSSCDNPYVEWDPIAAERITHSGRPALRMHGTLSVDIRWLELESVRRSEPGVLAVVGSELPERIGPHPRQGHLDVVVADCAGAADVHTASFALELQTTPPIEALIAVDGYHVDTTVELVRLIEDSCERTP